MMQKNNYNTGEIVLYKAKDGLAVDVKLYKETVWLTQKQMATLFGKDVRTINEHIKNIFKEGELKEKPVIRKFRITASDGKQYETNFYNLDVTISVGYRVKSIEGTQFRIWAANVLKNHLIKGFTINKKRLQEKGLEEFEKSIALIKNTIETKQLSDDEKAGLLKVITNYAQSWALLQKYDENRLTEPGKKKKPEYILTYEIAVKSITELKKNLIRKKQAGDLLEKNVLKCLKVF